MRPIPFFLCRIDRFVKTKIVGFRFNHSVNDAKIYLKNSLFSGSRTIEEKKVLTWYSCGPTVYDDAHIGHARTYICTDVIRRILRDIFHKDIVFAMGITDIDDKIINKGSELGLQDWKSIEAIVRGLERDFFYDMDSLNVLRPDAVLRVTEHIDSIILYIEEILKQNKAYIVDDGIYFDVKLAESVRGSLNPFEGYCEGQDSESVVNGTITYRSTITSFKSQKKFNKDFVLWKFSKNGKEVNSIFYIC